MTDIHDEEWMRKEARSVKSQQAHRAPGFRQVWDSAIARQHERQFATSPLAMWYTIGASTIILLVVISFFRAASTPQRTNLHERDFAAVEGALLTYWQAPSDAFLEEISTEPPSEP